MAAKKKAKAKKKAPAPKTKKKAKKTTKTVAKKAKTPPAKKAKKVAKKAAKKEPAKKAPAKKVVAKKTPAKKKKQVMGEGDYEATRKFDADQSSFVARNKAKIPEMGKAAEKALEGPEGDSLREAEAIAAGHSRDTFDA